MLIVVTMMYFIKNIMKFKSFIKCEKKMAAINGIITQIACRNTIVV